MPRDTPAQVVAAASIIGCCLQMLSGTGPASAAQPGTTSVTFVDEAADAGVNLMNVSGTREKRYIVDTTGAGACFLDYDLDGDMDLYIVNGATLETMGPSNPARNALYRNDGAGRFTEVGEQAGVADNGWSGGCAVGDYDNDGDPDVYVTNYGPNVLYRNEGNGRFSDATAAAGVADRRWSLGAAFVDVDRDGDLDLYVANYLRFSSDDPAARSSDCRWKGVPVMCGPRGFPGEADTLYRNQGDGTFVDASVDAGVAGRALFGMGVVAGDVDEDGDEDIFVANDSQDNHLFFNDGSGRFEDGALLAGVALSGDGRQQASMGSDLGDHDNDGDEDLFVTNFSDDYHTLYRNDGKGLFTDVTAAAGLDPARRSSLGWGTGFFDYDNDGDLDLFVATGHVYPQVDGNDPATSYRQQNLLFRNEGSGRFVNVSDQSGPALLQRRSSRGVAFGDYDDDGDLDIAVINENDVPALLRNDGGNNRRWLKVRLVGRQSNRDGIGARVYVRAGGRLQSRAVRLSGGYCSSHDPRIHFGLDREPAADSLEVRWPSGKRQRFDNVSAGHLITIDEERGITDVVSPGRMTRAAEPRRRVGSTPRPAATILPDAPRTPSPGAARPLSANDLREIDHLVQTGTVLIMSGQYAEGIGNYERALARLPPWEVAAKTSDALGFGNPERYRMFLGSLYDNLGVGLMRAERMDECAAAIERGIALVPARARFHHNLGLCHFHGRRYPEAARALRAARAAGEPEATLSYDLGRTLALAGRCKEALAELSLALEHLPTFDPQGRRAERWYYLGSCYADEERHQDAANAFRETLALTPGHQKALYKMGLARRRAGDTGSAERIQALFQARQPAHEGVRSARLAGIRTPSERLVLARLLADAGLPSHAVTDLEMVLASRPADASALVLLGESYLALRPPAFDQAQRAFGRALQ
ncbi:MAG: FG-GAP-like repeat-containing protein, partial [Vicinamibacterales bacterium]